MTFANVLYVFRHQMALSVGRADAERSRRRMLCLARVVSNIELRLDLQPPANGVWICLI